MRKRNPIGFLTGAVLVLIIALPLLSMLPWIFTERWTWEELLPARYSLRALKHLLAERGFAQLLIRSVLISTAVAFLSVITATMSARAIVHHELRFGNALYLLAILPFLVPATVFGMGVQGLFLRWHLDGTMLGVILVHLVYAQPYSLKLMVDAMRALGPQYEEQARVLGASPMRAFWRVNVPLLLPSMLVGFSMSYIISFSQYFLTLIIGSGRIKTFSMVMVPYLQGGQRNFGALYAFLFLGINVLLLAASERIARRFYGEENTAFFSAN